MPSPDTDRALDLDALKKEVDGLCAACGFALQEHPLPVDNYGSRCDGAVWTKPDELRALIAAAEERDRLRKTLNDIERIQVSPGVTEERDRLRARDRILAEIEKMTGEDCRCGDTYPTCVQCIADDVLAEARRRAEDGDE